MKVTHRRAHQGAHIGESGLVNFKAVKESLHNYQRGEIFRAVIIEEYLLFVKTFRQPIFPLFISNLLVYGPAGISDQTAGDRELELQSGPSLSPSRPSRDQRILSSLARLPFPVNKGDPD